MIAAQPRSVHHVWFALSSLWGAWFVTIFLTSGQSFVQMVIWGGALLVGATTAMAMHRRFSLRRLPPEVQLLVVFFFWSLMGILFVNDYGLFVRYVRQIVQLILIVTLLSFVIAKSGAVKPIFASFIILGAGLPVLRVLGVESGMAMENLQSLDRVFQPNALGFQSILGVLGVLALIPETRSWIWRSALLVAGFLALYGVILSGSRGAFVALFMVFALWPLFCFRSLFRSRWMAVTFFIIVGALGYYFYEFVLDGTNLGRRLQYLERFEDGSTQTRWQLFLMGFKLAYESWGVGTGLGQFGFASGTGKYAHSEFAELLGTTGVVGVILYYLAYLSTWRRLQNAARHTNERSVAYRINFAKMMLVVLVVSGLIFRPNFLSQDSMFLYALIVGISLWVANIQKAGDKALAVYDHATSLLSGRKEQSGGTTQYPLVAQRTSRYELRR